MDTLDRVSGKKGHCVPPNVVAAYAWGLERWPVGALAKLNMVAHMITKLF